MDCDLSTPRFFEAHGAQPRRDADTCRLCGLLKFCALSLGGEHLDMGRASRLVSDGRAALACGLLRFRHALKMLIKSALSKKHLLIRELKIPILSACKRNAAENVVEFR